MVMRLSTRIVRLLLLSPFHGLVDDRVMLLTVLGRRSGRRYSLPVRYAMEGRTITVAADAADHTTWWLNLVRPAPVVVRIGGRSRNAVASVEWDADEADRALAGYAKAYPGLLPPSPGPAEAAAAPGGRLAVLTRTPRRRDFVVVRIALAADLG
jgi:deazaflavin-dependent oxidoreductase (nitroreductase family)